MNISLTEPLKKFVEDQLEKGFYHSQSEIIRAGLRLLQQQQAEIDSKIALSLKQIKEGEYSEADNEFWETLENEVVKEVKNY